MWNRSSVQVQCIRQGAQGWCTGMTMGDGMGREEGGGFRMGNECTPMAYSCQCMAKTTTILPPIKINLKNNINKQGNSDRKRQIPCDFTQMWNIKNKWIQDKWTNQRKQKHADIKSRVEVTRGEGLWGWEMGKGDQMNGDRCKLNFLVGEHIVVGFPSGSDGKESACNAGYWSSIPGLGRSPGEGNGYPLQYSSLKNSMDRGAWHVHGAPKSQTQVSD